jgi:hypothetical protein
MSCYKDKAFNPKTNTYEEADFIDDHFGRHCYGITFGDGDFYTPEQLKKAEEQFKKEI